MVGASQLTADGPNGSMGAEVCPEAKGVKSRLRVDSCGVLLGFGGCYVKKV